MNDHQVCEAIRAGRRVADLRALFRAEERGLVDLRPVLTEKGRALLDGIEPTACSGSHVGGAEPAGDWIETRRLRKMRGGRR